MSGWTNVTIETVDELPPVASSEPHVDPEEVAIEKVEDWGLDHWYDMNFRASTRHWGQPDGRYSDGEAYELMEEIDAIERMLVVYANDTGDDGVGWLYERSDDGTPIVVDEKEGYGGARGHDVTGYFSDEHHIRGTANSG